MFATSQRMKITNFMENMLMMVQQLLLNLIMLKGRTAELAEQQKQRKSRAAQHTAMGIIINSFYGIFLERLCYSPPQLSNGFSGCCFYVKTNVQKLIIM